MHLDDKGLQKGEHTETRHNTRRHSIQKREQNLHKHDDGRQVLKNMTLSSGLRIFRSGERWLKWTNVLGSSDLMVMIMMRTREPAVWCVVIFKCTGLIVEGGVSRAARIPAV